MSTPRWSSRDWYHTLVAIEEKVRRLPCRGLHEDDAKGWCDLLEYIQAERENCARRADAASKATERKTRQREEDRSRAV